jgi:mannan endo-1,4-beta-mannosidase
MKSRLIMLAAIAVAIASVGIAVSRIQYSPSAPAPVHASLRPMLSSYLGVYEAGLPDSSYQSVEEFAQAADRQPNLVGYFSGWAEPFDSAFAGMLLAHHVIPFVQIDPTDASVASIAAGDYDDYLREYADAVRAFGHSVVIGFGHEMNATWYSWGYGHVPARTFVAAWRHLVTLFHQQGADNVTWLWTIQADIPGSGPVGLWWPGAQYVSWVGIDGFYYRPSNDFANVFGQTIRQVRTFTSKPVLLSEAAVGPDAGQFAGILGLFKGMAADQTLGLVWFDIAQHGGIYHQDWRIEDSQPAEETFRLGVREEMAPATSTQLGT